MGPVLTQQKPEIWVVGIPHKRRWHEKNSFAFLSKYRGRRDWFNPNDFQIPRYRRRSVNLMERWYEPNDIQIPRRRSAAIMERWFEPGDIEIPRRRSMNEDEDIPRGRSPTIVRRLNEQLYNPNAVDIDWLNGDDGDVMSSLNRQDTREPISRRKRLAREASEYYGGNTRGVPEGQISWISPGSMQLQQRLADFARAVKEYPGNKAFASMLRKKTLCFPGEDPTECSHYKLRHARQG